LLRLGGGPLFNSGSECESAMLAALGSADLRCGVCAVDSTSSGIDA
jgi:hypothetical protein